MILIFCFCLNRGESELMIFHPVALYIFGVRAGNSWNSCFAVIFSLLSCWYFECTLSWERGLKSCFELVYLWWTIYRPFSSVYRRAIKSMAVKRECSLPPPLWVVCCRYLRNWKRIAALFLMMMGRSHGTETCDYLSLKKKFFSSRHFTLIGLYYR